MNTRKTKYRKSFVILLVIQMLILFSITAFADGNYGIYNDYGGYDVVLHMYYNSAGECTVTGTLNGITLSETRDTYINAKDAYYKTHNKTHYGYDPDDLTESGLMMDTETVNYELGRFLTFANQFFDGGIALAYMILVNKAIIAVIMAFFASDTPQVRHKQIMNLFNVLLKIAFTGFLYFFGKPLIIAVMAKLQELNQPVKTPLITIMNAVNTGETIRVFLLGIMFLTAIIAFIKFFLSLSMYGSNPQKRSQIIAGMVFSGSLLALAGSGLLFTLAFGSFA